MVGTSVRLGSGHKKLTHVGHWWELDSRGKKAHSRAFEWIENGSECQEWMGMDGNAVGMDVNGSGMDGNGSGMDGNAGNG